MQTQSLNKKIVITTIILAIFGLIMVFDGSMGLVAQRYHYIMLQSIWMVIGSIAAFIMYKFDYKKLKNYSFFLITVTIIFLFIVYFFSSKINGSQRWISLFGVTSFQPSEFAKLFFILYISAWLTKFQEKKSLLIKDTKDNIKNFLIPYLIITMVIAGMILIEKDMGTTIIIVSISIFILFANDNNNFFVIDFIITSLTYLGLGTISIIVEPYRLQRLLTYLKGNHNTSTNLGSGYQVHQILIAIGTGGLTGVGFTQSIQKNQYLVGNTAITDSIFAIIAEELGLIGALVLIALYLYLIYLILKVATNTDDYFGKLVATGIAAWIGIQAFINIAANIGVIPLTGVPLPLISYGGSSVIALLTSIGIVLSINSKHNAK